MFFGVGPTLLSALPRTPGLPHFGRQQMIAPGNVSLKVFDDRWHGLIVGVRQELTS
jgi:hypothetical protein